MIILGDEIPFWTIEELIEHELGIKHELRKAKALNVALKIIYEPTPGKED